MEERLDNNKNNGVIQMPNWCQNRLEVYGPESEIQKFNERNFQIGQDTEILRSPEMITFSFQSVWEPPVKYVGQMAKEFPKLNFDLYYYEPGTMIAGAVEYKNGMLFRDEHHEDDDEAVHDFVWDAFSTDINLLTTQ